MLGGFHHPRPQRSVEFLSFSMEKPLKNHGVPLLPTHLVLLRMILLFTRLVNLLLGIRRMCLFCPVRKQIQAQTRHVCHICLHWDCSNVGIYSMDFHGVFVQWLVVGG